MAKKSEKVAEAKKEVAVKAEAGLPALVSSMEQDGAAGAGFEDIKITDCALPFLAVIQSNSPQLLPGKGAKNAKIGSFFNNVTGEAIDAPIDFISCAFKNVMVEWGLRELGGGFKKQHTAAEGEALLKTCHKDDKGRDILPNGNHLQNTNYHMGLLVKAGGGYERAVIGFVSTQLKKSKKWNTQMLGMQLPKADGKGMFRPPVFGMIYSLGTVAESNAKGNWMGFTISNPRRIEDPGLYAVAKAFYGECQSGAVVAQPPAPVEEPEAGPAVESQNVM
jgi:hypothetical protein